jgi:hypothetical protein
MNKTNYKYVFLKSGSQYQNIISSQEESFYGTLSDKPFLSVGNDLEKEYKNWNIIRNNISDTAFEGKYSFRMDSNNIYSPAFILTVPDSMKEFHSENIYIQFKTLYFESSVNATEGSLFVFSVDSNNQPFYYKSYDIKKLADSVHGLWRKSNAGFRVPENLPDSSLMRFYIWNRERKEYLLDNIEIEFYTIDE